jgi:molybdopterin synthase catalytic subunit
MQILNNKYFVQQAISLDTLNEVLKSNQQNPDIGAYHIFMGQVRGDVLDRQTVQAIEYTAHIDMAQSVAEHLIDSLCAKHHLSGFTFIHSLGKVKTSEICLLVIASSAHRKAAQEACIEFVERLKKEVPIWGKEIFDTGNYQWKENTDRR